MSRIDALKKINRALKGETVDFSAFDSELERLKKSLTETVNIQTVDDVSRKLKQFQDKIDFTPLLVAIETIKSQSNTQSKEIEAALSEKIKELVSLETKDMTAGVAVLENDIKNLSTALAESHLSTEKLVDGLYNEVRSILSVKSEMSAALEKLSKDTSSYTDREVSKVEKTISELRASFLERIGNIGGGSMPHQTYIGGVNPLTKYSDLNFKAGSNMSITYANNNTTRQVDITFTASGGGAGTNFETPTGAVNDTNTTFTVLNTPVYINVNGLIYTEGNGIYTSYAGGTITLNTPVGSGGFIISAY